MAAESIEDNGAKNMKNKKLYLLIVAILVTAWVFRYDTYCGQLCVSYDRFTGKWYLTYELAEGGN